MIELDKLVRKNIIELKPYSSARDEFYGDAAVFLDANENPYGLLNRYPDPYQSLLKKHLARTFDFSPSQLFLGNGSDELIDLVFRIFCEPGKDKSLTFEPTYGMYQVSSEINNIELIKLQLDKSFEIDFETLAPWLSDKDLKLIILCSPNNPTGNCVSEDTVRQILNEFKGILLIDEAYIDFAPEFSMIRLVEDFSNLIIMRTMSKAWGLAAARIGIALAHESVVGYLIKVKPPYNISSLNQQAAITALENPDIFRKNMDLILSEKNNLIMELNKLDVITKVYPSQTNFLLIEVTDADILYEYLIQKKIIVRNRNKQIPNCLRLSIGTKKENKLLIDSLKEFTHEEGIIFR